MRYTVAYTFEGRRYSSEALIPVPHFLLADFGPRSQVTVLVDPAKPEQFTIKF